MPSAFTGPGIMEQKESDRRKESTLLFHRLLPMGRISVTILSPGSHGPVMEAMV